MKKWMGVLMAAVLAAGTLMGCGGAGSAAEGTKAETSASKEAGSEAVKESASGEAGSKAAGEKASGEAGSEAAKESASKESLAAEPEAVSGKHHVEIAVKDYGTIAVELDGDSAPITVGNFLELARDGFYDGLTFHRIISGFMIQGGDPLGNGMGGSEREIKGEFANNGVENPLSHTRGAISMARAQDKDSASSQFFIVHEDSTFLDGDYACFGYVTDGMDVVDAICADTKVEDNNGSVARENQPVIESITVID